MERTGRLWLLEKHTEFWDGEEWVEFTFDSSAAKYLGIPLAEIDHAPRRAREVICQISFDQLREENLAAGFEPEDFAQATAFKLAGLPEITPLASMTLEVREFGTPAQDFIEQGFEPIANVHRFDVLPGEPDEVEIHFHPDGHFLMTWTQEKVFEQDAWKIAPAHRPAGDALQRCKIHGYKEISRAEAAKIIRNNCIPKELAADVLAKYTGFR